MPKNTATIEPETPEVAEQAPTAKPNRKRSTKTSRNGKADVSLNEFNDLQSQLEQKQKLVGALTARLEQAAEQLDRSRRSGSGRGADGGGIPPELVAEQRELTEELQRAIHQWEDMQVGASLGRLEIQVTELREFIGARLDSAAPGAHFDAPANSQHTAQSATEQETPQESNSANDALSAYEMMKADMLAADQPATPEPAAHDVAASDTSSPESPSVTPQIELPQVDPPIDIDVDNASPKELRTAVESRDAYISYMIQKLRVTESSTRIAGDWASLESVPDELRANLEKLEKRLEDAHRIAEVEKSLERARLSREASRLGLLDQQIQTQLKKSGLDQKQDGKSKDKQKPPENVKKRKGGWLRRRGNSDD